MYAQGRNLSDCLKILLPRNGLSLSAGKRTKSLSLLCSLSSVSAPFRFSRLSRKGSGLAGLDVPLWTDLLWPGLWLHVQTGSWGPPVQLRSWRGSVKERLHGPGRCS